MTRKDHPHDLLAPWALRALPPEEDRLVPHHMADCEQCAAEAERLRATVRMLDGAAPTERADTRLAPPEALLARARARRAPVPPTAPHAEPYAAAVSALEALLGELDGPAAPWGTPVIHDWSVQDTVAHLIAADEHLALHLGLPANAPPTTAPAEGTGWRTAWASRTQRVIAHERARAPGDTVATWRAQANALLTAPEAHDPERAARPALLVGARLPVADHFLVRAFETWIHADDIGRALERPVPPPPPAHLWRLVRLGIRILGLALGPQALPVALTVTDATRTTEWILGSEDEPVHAELALDPLDFCYLIGGRTAPETVSRTTTGDEGTARTFLDRASRLAWL
ncbi:maleylpyruvate isomerase family mycothiol-dependent enzyme [Streptomyces sp. Q6]|uniref:Maleylpyruvate isomerase family mycothiol-dependent enzyme n=1 Tax=Streptomyces citrinus TaxID=3118173 RepID=A0ACD5A8T8_9ACTN